LVAVCALVAVGAQVLVRMGALVLLLAKREPLHKGSDAYMEGKDVVKVVHLLASGNAPPKLFSFNARVLAPHAAALLAHLTRLLDLAFGAGPPELDAGDDDALGNGTGGVEVQLLTVCLAALMALFRLPEFCREVKRKKKRDKKKRCV
jgi:hypothetical protein